MQQWTSEAPNAGFTTATATPWLPIPPSARAVNAEVESRQPDSLLNFYKTVLTLRHTEPVLMFGDYVTLNPEFQGSTSVFSLSFFDHSDPRETDFGFHIDRVLRWILREEGMESGIRLPRLVTSAVFKSLSCILHQPFIFLQSAIQTTHLN